MVVGITGGIGSGKSTVVKMFKKFENVAVYLADDQAKKLMNSSEEIRTLLIKEFSSEVYKNGHLNRSFLANIVFNDKEKISILNSIVHPVVNLHFKDFITKNSNKMYVLYENAILFENAINVELCDFVITVTAPKDIRIERVMLRDKITKDAIESRMNNQWDDAKKIIQSNYVITNIGLEETKYQVRKIHSLIVK